MFLCPTCVTNGQVMWAQTSSRHCFWGGHVVQVAKTIRPVRRSKGAFGRQDSLLSDSTLHVAIIGPFPYGEKPWLSALEAAARCIHATCSVSQDTITRSDSFSSEEQDHGLVPRLRASASTLHGCMAADMSDVAGTDRSQKLLHRAPDAHSLSILC